MTHINPTIPMIFIAENLEGKNGERKSALRFGPRREERKERNEPELHLSVDVDWQEVDNDDEEEQRCNPGGLRDSRVPV